MNELTEMHCIKIQKDTLKISELDLRRHSGKMPSWLVYDKNGELRLEKEFKFAAFNDALAFTNRIAQEANQEDHHPAILTEWGKVTVTWWTHRIHGLHLNDFIMAAKTDQIFEAKTLG
jgi:4a-hydroxytetrahydrobiopterin dehydratase